MNSPEELLKEKILSRYKSIRAFAQSVEIPYSTLDTMLKKGIASTSFATVAKVCLTLDISLTSLLPSEWMATGRFLEEVTFAERRHLEEYRRMDAYGRTAVDQLIALEAKRSVEQGIPSRGEWRVAARNPVLGQPTVAPVREFDPEQMEEESEF